MKKYFYEGPVLMFDRVITDRWCGATCAVSEKKALSNLMYQYKLEYRKNSKAKVALLPEKLSLIGVFPDMPKDGIQISMDFMKL